MGNKTSSPVARNVRDPPQIREVIKYVEVPARPQIKTVIQRVEVPAPPPPPKPIFDEPWRKINWGDKVKLLEVLNKFKPVEGVQHLRFLVYGPVGAGKSSFINSVTSALYERMAIPTAVNTSACATKSFTVQYETHRIYKDEGDSDEPYPFVFNDIMGLESGDSVGVRPEDIKLAMMGHVKDGYKFNPISPLSQEDLYYNPHPSIDDKVHVLVLMLSANCPEIDPDVIKKMKEVRETARDLGIPQIAIGTQIDVQCEEIEENIQNIYKSVALKTKMTEFSQAVGIPLNCIMGVQNYSEENDNNEDIDILILTALKHMVNFGKDFIRKKIVPEQSPYVV